MSIQLKTILLATKLLNIKKPFTLTGDNLIKEVTKKQKKPATPKASQFKNYKRKQIQINNQTNYKFEKKSDHLIVYLPGGGFVLPITSMHWDYLNQLSQQVQADFLVLNYPLAPAHKVDEVMSFIHKALSLEMKNYSKITLMGDSAGGNTVLAYAQSDYNEGKRIQDVIALSPFVDFTLSNPEIKEVEKRDTIVATPALKEIGEWYRGEHSLDNPILSPINADFTGLNVLIISGTRDITNPDTRLLADKNQQINYLEEVDMPHVYMIFDIPEAQKAKKIIIDTFTN